LLGPVRAWADGTEVGLGRPRQRCVLAVLLMEANRVVPIETIVDRVWGDDPPVSVRNVVYGYIGKLKSALRQADAEAAGVRLDRRPGGYTLRTPTERVDLYRFRDLAAQARTQEAVREPDTDDRTAELLEQALELWHGEEDGRRRRAPRWRASASAACCSTTRSSCAGGATRRSSRGCGT
jgi:DNA-binding SARP family transcriptional activator